MKRKAKRKGGTSPRTKKAATSVSGPPSPLPSPQGEGAGAAGQPRKREGKNRGGRPAKITAAVVEEVATLMANGTPEYYACLLVGVNDETYGSAVSRNPEFKRIKDTILARWVNNSCVIIKQGGERVKIAAGLDNQGNPVFEEKIVPWTGHAWMLERRCKPYFNKTDTIAPSDTKGKDKTLEADFLELERVMKQQILGQSATGGERGN